MILPQKHLVVNDFDKLSRGKAKKCMHVLYMVLAGDICWCGVLSRKSAKKEAARKPPPH